jgi:dynactin-4
MKIKMLALNYLPEIEVGRRRRKITTDVGVAGTPEEIERRRRERRRTRGRAEEEDEDMTKPIRAGELVSQQWRLLAYSTVRIPSVIYQPVV